MRTRKKDDQCRRLRKGRDSELRARRTSRGSPDGGGRYSEEIAFFTDNVQRAGVKVLG